MLSTTNVNRVLHRSHHPHKIRFYHIIQHILLYFYLQWVQGNINVKKKTTGRETDSNGIGYPLFDENDIFVNVVQERDRRDSLSAIEFVLAFYILIVNFWKMRKHLQYSLFTNKQYSEQQRLIQLLFDHINTDLHSLFAQKRKYLFDTLCDTPGFRRQVGSFL